MTESSINAAPYAAHPPLAVLAATLRAPLLPMIGFADLIASTAQQPEVLAWAQEISAGSRQALAVLDATLALAAGRAPATVDREASAAAMEAVAALRELLHPGTVAGWQGPHHH